MAEFYLVPLDRPASTFMRNTTFRSKEDAIEMLAFQGYGVLPQDPDYWGHELQIVQRVDIPVSEAYTEPMTLDPAIEAIKAKVHAVRVNALGPHLDTPIYDQLAREYDKKYNNLNYFDTALAKRLELIGRHNR